MLSGIGPKTHLKEMGIPVQLNLPVGDHLKDHPSMTLHTFVSDPRTVNTGAQLDIGQLHQYFHNASGPLTEFYHTIAYFNTKYNDDPKWPDVSFETIVQRYPDTLDNPTVTLMHDRKQWAKYFEPYLDQYYLEFQPILERVNSYGKLRLVSNNPFDYPLIDPNFLDDPIDYKAFFEATKFMIEFIETSSFSKYVEPFRAIPGCRLCPNSAIHECDAYVDCLIRQLTRTGYHPIGTARLGDVSRDDVVVSPRLKVKGTANLRVCDSSIMPEIINANTNAAAIMIGEKCADLIKEDNGHWIEPDDHYVSVDDTNKDKPSYTTVDHRLSRNDEYVETFGYNRDQKSLDSKPMNRRARYTYKGH